MTLEHLHQLNSWNNKDYKHKISKMKGAEEEHQELPQMLKHIWRIFTKKEEFQREEDTTMGLEIKINSIKIILDFQSL